MATQYEVIDAFFNGDNKPYSASNFRLETNNSTPFAYLVGDSRLVYARREPINRFTVYSGAVTGSLPRLVDRVDGPRLSYDALRDQKDYVVRNATRRNDEINVEVVDEFPPHVYNVDEDFHPFTQDAN